MKRRVMAGILAVLMVSATPVTAGTAELPEQFRRQIERDPEQAIKTFANMIAEIAPDGTLTTRLLEHYEASGIAQLRAAKLQALMMYDLDFDGVLTSQEVQDAVFGRRDRRMADVFLMMADGDKDGDGALSFDEMRAVVLADMERDGARGLRRRGDYTALMALDMDGDGSLNIAEMARAVRAMAEGKCPDACKSD